MTTVLHESDWLGTNSIFMNSRKNTHSDTINSVIENDNIRFHPEGFNNYLQFGYSVFEQTPLTDITFSRFSSQLVKTDDQTLKWNHLEDPVEKNLDYKLSETDIIDLIRYRVQEWESKIDGCIAIPTSGGYDSRLLNWCIRDKSRIRAYTYGLSNNQSKSTEVLYAEYLCKKLGISWEQIPLEGGEEYLLQWLDHFGISVHAHGMYQIEFFNKLKSKVDKSKNLLSGIIGDAWAGSIDVPHIESAEHLIRLALSHSVSVNPSHSKLKTSNELAIEFFNKNKNKLRDYRYRIITLIRFKMILLKYLVQLPTRLGFITWSPYLDMDIAIAMLNLPEHRRKHRIWQRDFFCKEGIDVESLEINSDNINILDIILAKKTFTQPLCNRIFDGLIDDSFIEWINRNIKNDFSTEFNTKLIRLLQIPKIGGLLNRLGLKSGFSTQQQALFSLAILWPIQRLLQEKKDNRIV